MNEHGFSWEDLDLFHMTSDLSEGEPVGGRGLRERAQAHQDLVTFIKVWPNQVPSLAPEPTLTRYLVLTPLEIGSIQAGSVFSLQISI